MSSTSRHYLFDPISGEGSMTFEEVDSARVCVIESAHPDLPADIKIIAREEAREVYRRAIRAGWVRG